MDSYSGANFPIDDDIYTNPMYILEFNNSERSTSDHTPPEDDQGVLNKAVSSSENCTIEDISYNKGTPSMNTDIEDLRALLISWNQEHLLDQLIGEKVFPNILRVIKRHHIERLLKKFDLGTQILFEHNLERWRHMIGIPLGNATMTVDTLSSSPVASPPSTPNSDDGRASPSGAFRYSPYSSIRCSSSDPGWDITLSNILNTTPRASMLLEYYEKFSKFEEEQRNTLIGIISRHFEEKSIIMTMKTSYRLEKEILERFPTEKIEYYRTNKRGKIYNKWRNSHVSFKNAVSNHLSSNSKSEKEKETRPVITFVPEEDAEAIVRSLKFDNLTKEEFDNCWRACSKYRLNDINTKDSTQEILKKWPFYKEPSGFRLIDMDFNVKYNNGDGLLGNWEKEIPKLINFLEQNVKDKQIKILLSRLKNEDIEKNGRDAALLWAMHGYFVPTTKLVRKDVSGKAHTIKFTIRDSQRAFLYLARTAQEMEEWIHFLNSKKTSIQPFVFAIGEDITGIQEVYTYFDGIRYKFFNVIRAVDICLKIIYVFNLNFSPECVMIWSFIEKYFYNLEPNNSSSKIHIICEYLKKQE